MPSISTMFYFFCGDNVFPECFFLLIIALVIAIYNATINHDTLFMRYLIMHYGSVIMVSAVAVRLLVSLITNDFQTGFRYKFFLLGSSTVTEFSGALDGVSTLFLLLTLFLTVLCFLFIQRELKTLHDRAVHYIALLVMAILLMLFFTATNLISFFIFFEAVLIPIYFLVGLFGSRARKVRASYLLFLFTYAGSVLFLLTIAYLEVTHGSTSFLDLGREGFLSDLEQKVIWITLFLAFACKVPIFPMHVWLPEAHAEASTIGSVLLAGILLKLGVYGIYRICIGLLGGATAFYSIFISILCICGVLYCSVTVLRQTDLKRIVAYSSISHMNLVVLGLVNPGEFGAQGAIFQSLSHGLTAPALFFAIGMLYSRYHSRELSYYVGLAQTMPSYSGLYLLLSMANISLPGTSSFLGEFLILSDVMYTNPILGFLATFSVVLGAAYTLWTYNRMFHGGANTHNIQKVENLTMKELTILVTLVLLIIILGIAPNSVLYFIP